jgi:hypothetical protein
MSQDNGSPVIGCEGALVPTAVFFCTRLARDTIAGADFGEVLLEHMDARCACNDRITVYIRM